MNFYLNYAREHWTRPDENPPVGLILCADHGGGVAKYALEIRTYVVPLDNICPDQATET